MKYLTETFNTPWKAYYEILMYLIKPLVLIYLKLVGVDIGKGAKFYGFPKIFKHKGSKINIGDNFECRNWKYSNPLGINHATILCTWSEEASIEIGDDVGISGSSIVANKSIIVGNGTLVGANSTIIDTDFHPTSTKNRRYKKEGTKSKPIKIGKNVFIGMNAILLKGVRLTDNSIVPAGAVNR